MRYLALLACVGSYWLAHVAFAADAAPPPDSAKAIVFETQAVKLALGGNGEVIGLVDRQSGIDYADRSKPIPFAKLHTASASYPATVAAQTGDRLRLGFGEGLTAELRITSHEYWFVIEVLSVNAPDAKSLDIVDLPLKLKGDAAEPMAACVLALNLRTNVTALPQASSRLQATCYAKFGMPGAKAAVIVCPQPRLRDVMKQVVLTADELPHSPIGGPWALDAPANRGSYILDCTGNTNEQTIDEWIRMLRAMGISQLDFHCGRCLRFGDLTPHPQVHPRGLAGVRAMNDKLHAAGMLAGLHTYAFFIAKDSPFVTPVPDRGLASDAAYTLSEAVKEDAKTLTVSEPTDKASAVTGFFIRNSVTLRIDDELVIYKGVRKESPFGFTECQRGAYGTKPAAHAAGAQAMHLKECFGLFVPDPNSPLFAKVIECTAEAYNQGGFDMIYLDALDGSDILGGSEYAWYYGSKFVFELARRLNKPALFEMSTFHHHLWYVRSRMGAWDAIARGARPFIEIHRLANESCSRMFLPPHLGWWAMQSWQGIQPERTFPETIEYLCARCIADGCGLSFLASVPPEAFAKKNLRFGGIIRQYEELRRTDAVSPQMRQRLGVPGDEYTLDQVDGGKVRFRPAQYDRHKIDRLDAKGNTWPVQNRFATQPLMVRIEAMLSTEGEEASEAVVIENFGDPAVFSNRQVPPGTSATLDKTADRVKAGTVSGRLAVTGRPATNPPWAMIGRKFSPCINLVNKGLGFWVYGDGRGELLNVQIKSPVHAIGGRCDRYVKIDFEGWKYVELIEPESDDIPDHGWPYMPRRSEWAAHRGELMGAAYPTFHYWVAYDQIEELNLWYGDLPAGDVTCAIGPIKALPLKPCKMRNPAVTVGGKTLTFATELQTGQYVECRSAADCKLYDADGNVVGDLTPRGDWPDLKTGGNKVRFSAEPLPGPHPRAAVTVISRGEP